MRAFGVILGVCLLAVLSGCGSGSDSTGVDQAPSLGAVTPADGGGKTQVFAATYSHPKGARQVISAFFLVEKTATGINSCFLEYNSSTNSVNLMNDSGKWQTALPAGSAGALANTQCSVDAAGVRGTADANTLTVTLPVTFASGYAGPKQIFLSASAARLATPWVEKGRWVVP